MQLKDIKDDDALLAASVLVVVLKILHVADREFLQAFDGLVVELGKENSSTLLNQFSAVIFDLVQQPL